jgi:hypothetical protein
MNVNSLSKIAIILILFPFLHGCVAAMLVGSAVKTTAMVGKVVITAPIKAVDAIADGIADETDNKAQSQ